MITPRIKEKAPHKRPKTVTSSSSINLCTISIICCITDSFYDHPISGKPIFHRMNYIVRNNHEEGCSWRRFDSARVLVTPAESLPARDWC